MSLDSLDKQIEAVRARAVAAQQNSRNQKAAINADPLLSQEGKNEQIAGITAHTKTAIEQLRVEEEKLATDKKASLERVLTGSAGSDSTAIVAYRDAQDRADKLDNPTDAGRILKRAINSGDKTLAAAVAQAALNNGWRDVSDTYAKENPTIAEAAKDLADLDSYFNNVGSVMSRAMYYSVS